MSKARQKNKVATKPSSRRSSIKEEQTLIRNDYIVIKTNHNLEYKKSIAKHIVFAHKGKITIESQINIGTKASITLPKT